MEAIIIISIIILISIIFVISYIKKIQSGSCCSTRGNENISKVKVADKNKNHYPYKRILQIGGMTCSNCAKKIENNFNKLGNVYAKVNFDKEELIILMKEELSDQDIENVIKDSGYRYFKILKML